jgi:UPF0176 protein
MNINIAKPNKNIQANIQANILNVSSYKFIELAENYLIELKSEVYNKCLELNLKGTIILATEGVNIFLAGIQENINTFFIWLRATDKNYFFDVEPKESMSSEVPFRKLIVKIKAEIITMRMPVIRPQEKRAAAVAPKTLAKWLAQGYDDNHRPVVMLDTRNQFEVQVGTFDNSLNYDIEKFTQFPEQINKDKEALKDKTIVSFCTGGIRCEKAAIYMQNIGLENVYQLDGGILKYFEEVGGEHYTGECFVFDYRTALNPKLEVTGQMQCYGCRAVVSIEDQQSPLYQPKNSQCPQCAKAREELDKIKHERITQKIAEKMQERQAYTKKQKELHANKIAKS